MCDSGELDPLLEGFHGKVRLFPLPDCVVFPHVIQPLHVFESRYRDLVDEALTGDSLIAMAVLMPGWEGNYEGRPRLFPTACLGRIATHHRYDDGRYNLLLHGLRRIRLVRELAATKSFREAVVDVVYDKYPEQTSTAQSASHRRLLEVLGELGRKRPEAKDPLRQLLDGDVPLGALTDIVAYALPLETEFKQRLLEESDVEARAAMLVDRLGSKRSDIVRNWFRNDGEPPQFSLN